MNMKDIIANQELSKEEFSFIENLCKDWGKFSITVGSMDKNATMKVLKYLMDNRPGSNTLGKRAVQRFNILNKLSWKELVNGNREEN